MHPWEVGSEFDWSARYLKASSQANWMPNSYELFSTGTACLHALGRSRARPSAGQPRIHVPSFYCMDVVRSLQTRFQVLWYKDVPSDPAPDFDSIDAVAGDMVLATNTFGARLRQPWSAWTALQSDITIIEDHSHDPFSDWARHSSADYAFSSLRKTLPVPDGGMLYSPHDHPLPTARGDASPGSMKRLTAMLMKRAYLSGCDIDKAAYRQLEIDSQLELTDQSNSVASVEAAASAFTRNILACLDIDGMRQRKQANIRRFICLALTTPSPHWQPLFRESPEGSVPLNAIITCTNSETRNALRAFLIQRNIFTAIHWLQRGDVSSNDPSTLRLGDRVLTIPLDARYSAEDVDRVFEIMMRALDTVAPASLP